MNQEPRSSSDYGERQVEAARRVLIDLGQVLASWKDCIVVVGGWIPDLLMPDAEEPHVGSIDVDLALDAAKLNDGRYADILKSLLATRRYRRGERDFQLLVDVDLHDGGESISISIDFLAPKDVKLVKHKPKLIEDFRIIRADGCDTAFRAPVELSLPGHNVRGDKNTVLLRVISLSDFLIMKAHAIAGRDKPKDCYDLCYCLDFAPEGFEQVADDWRKRKGEANVMRAVDILTEKFQTVDSFGPRQVVEFYSSPDDETRSMQARRAYELVQKFLGLMRGFNV